MEKSPIQLEIERAQFKGELDDFITDGLEENSTVFVVIESEEQLLECRVGPVFYGDEKPNKIGLWISYQERAYEGKQEGPFLMSLDVFDKLVEYVNKKRNRFNK